MTTAKKAKARTKPDCLNGYGDGSKHCTLEWGHIGLCNHLCCPDKPMGMHAANCINLE